MTYQDYVALSLPPLGAVVDVRDTDVRTCGYVCEMKMLDGTELAFLYRSSGRTGSTMHFVTDDGVLDVDDREVGLINSIRAPTSVL